MKFYDKVTIYQISLTALVPYLYGLDVSNELLCISDRFLDTELTVVLRTVPHHIYFPYESPLALVMYHICQDF